MYFVRRRKKYEKNNFVAYGPDACRLFRFKRSGEKHGNEISLRPFR
jgi:hypothetical protein